MRNNLAEALKAAGRPELAAAVYRETVEHFPSNVVSRAGLAETLKAQGELDEVATVYRETVELFPSGVVSRAGLAGVLVEQGDLDAAAKLYREILELETQNEVAKTGLRTIERLRVASEVTEPRRPHGQTEPAPIAVAPQVGEARTWRRRARKSEGDEAARLRRQAAQILDELLEEHTHQPQALTEQVLLALDEGDAAKARSLFDGPAARLAAASPLLAAVSRLEREEARQTRRKLDEDSLRTAFDGPNPLRNLDGSAFTPLLHLQEGRAALSLSGGEKRLELAARHLERLRAWAAAQPKDAGDFAAWWAERVADHALDGKAQQAEIETGDVEVLDAWQRERGPELDELEEDYCLRQAALRSAPRIPAAS